MDIFKKNIKFLRERKGVKQSDMLNELGFKPSRWNSYEKLGTEPKYIDLVKIASFFDTSIDDLLTRDIEVNQMKDILLKPYETENIGNTMANETCKKCEYKDEIIRAKNGEIEALKAALEHAEKRLLNPIVKKNKK